MPRVTDPDTLIIFTTSPTGLGHIRVMDALIEGLSPGSDYTVIGVGDVNASKIHALGSRIPILLQLTEFVQNTQFLERIVTRFYQFFFSTRTRDLTNNLTEIRKNYPNKKKWIIVSTHFALSYPVVSVKKRLAQKFGIQIFNVLTVTDDSPQLIWASEGCDLIFTPSSTTENKLRELLPKDTKTIVQAISFPISPRLTAKLTEQELAHLENQVDPKKTNPLHISIPVSGASVQLPYLQYIVEILAREKFIFTVIGQLNMYTKSFFEKLIKIPHVQVSSGTSARATVNLYESSFFQLIRPACEITKPSEQAFKAILKPSERGGVIMLLTEPVGRQENDNLNFLTRHDLLADSSSQKNLEQYLGIDGKIPPDEENLIHFRASHWRALRLPRDAKIAANFIRNAKSSGLLYSMLSYIPETKVDLTSDGVTQIWNIVSEVVAYRATQAALNT